MHDKNDKNRFFQKLLTRVTRVHKPYPISDQNGNILYPISDQRGSKTIPFGFGATHTYMERLQKRALRIIYPNLSYAEALVAAGITSLYERRQVLSETLFDQIMEDPSHKLYDLMPPRNESTYCTLSRGYFELPICKTHRFRKTFIMNHSFNYN